MNYPYFGQTGQGATSVPPSNQPTNVQQVAPPQQNPQFLMNNQQFQGNQMGQPLFPQPTGSVYNLNTASDIGNVPAGVGISVGLCLQENVMYIKALQNGSPMLLGYRLSPIEGSASSGRGRGGRYRGDDRWNEHLDRIMDGADMYQYGRSRYRDGGDSERMYDGLEKLMYAICMFIESTMDFAESPEEKEIIRKHIQKLKNI